MYWPSASDIKKFDEIRQKMREGKYNYTPPKPPKTKTNYKYKAFIKPLLLASAGIATLEAFRYLYNKYNSNTWQYQPININQQVRKLHLKWKLNQIKSYFGYDKAYRQSLYGFINDTNLLKHRVSNLPLFGSQQAVSIERKVQYKFFFVQFGVSQKIRKIDQMGNLVQINRNSMIVVFWIRLFSSEKVKVIKKFERVHFSKDDGLLIVERVNDLYQKVDSSENLKGIQRMDYVNIANQIQDSLKTAYFVNS